MSAQPPAGGPAVTADRAYPATLAVSGANRRTVDLIRASGARVVAEIGVYRGYTSLAIAEVLAGEGELHLFDFEDRVREVEERLHAAGHRNVIAHGNSYKLADSYNWSLMRLLRASPEPIFDYVFLDGAHTWEIDALTFFLADRLLRVGGRMDFDDYGWSLEGSPSLNPAVFPRTAECYTEEQIRERHVRLIVDLLVRRDSRYREVVPNKVFQKVGPETGDALDRLRAAEAEIHARETREAEAERLRVEALLGVERLERALARERSDRAALEHAIGALEDALAETEYRERARKAASEEVGRLRTELYRVNLAQHVGRAVRAVAPEGARVLVVSKADDALLALDGREGLHFPQDAAGRYSGHRPADTAEIFARLEALRGRGPAFLVIPSFAFWWLEHYEGLRQRLDAVHRRVWRDAHCIVYSIGTADPAHESP